jgi:S-ribosylhomocysteine lyase
MTQNDMYPDVVQCKYGPMLCTSSKFHVSESYDDKLYDMEAFDIAVFCKDNGIKFDCYKIVSDYCNGQSSRTYRDTISDDTLEKKIGIVINDAFGSAKFTVTRIPSFQRDHNDIKPGLYLQESKRNIDIYDLRFVKPNTEVIPIDAIHTIEHLFATWLKTSNHSLQDEIVSFNPGGCQTMFYLEVFNDQHKITTNEVKWLIIDCIKHCLEQEEVPGASEVECGNYKSHNLEVAKQWLERYLVALKVNKCKCTWTDNEGNHCKRRGNCKACVAHHRQNDELPACYFPEDKEKTYDRSITNYTSKV